MMPIWPQETPARPRMRKPRRAPASIHDRTDIRPVEVGTDEEQGLTERYRESVRETVAEVQPRRVPVLAEPPKPAPRDPGMVVRHRDHIDPRPLNQEVELPLAVIPVSRLQHDPGLNERRGRDPARPGAFNGRNEPICGGLALEDRDDRRRVDYHGASARKPVLVIAEYLLIRPPVEQREARDPLLDPSDLLPQTARSPSPALTLEPFPHAIVRASVSDSPVRSASSRARRSASAFLILSDIAASSFLKEENNDRFFLCAR
jgi:hypothetical protein